ncbi:hypothetical protein [Taibaiella soli]|uniref:Uncharacterized protein n=1 Tax=Taibaiella soli TaxID=1649169 RepID=A0A2W2BYP5_9BACT|nr:hypothetical protein [Taibaiella soli]PZF73003.1 hypothetical protein DN068_11375 [Taibaiella soli]
MNTAEIAKISLVNADNEETVFLLEKLVRQAFSRLASPLHNNGLYTELQQLVTEAFLLGKNSLPVPGLLFPMELDNG